MLPYNKTFNINTTTGFQIMIIFNISFVVEENSRVSDEIRRIQGGMAVD